MILRIVRLYELMCEAIKWLYSRFKCSYPLFDWTFRTLTIPPLKYTRSWQRVLECLSTATIAIVYLGFLALWNSRTLVNTHRQSGASKDLSFQKSKKLEISKNHIQ